MTQPNLPGGERFYTVSELTGMIRTLLEDALEDVWVKGEISNFAVPKSGHFYFTLKDAGAQVRAVCFKGSQWRIRFRPANGMEVLARGRISVYEPRGEYQLIVAEMMDYGLGNLQRAFEQLKEKLRAEGLFEATHKQTLPLLPARVGVVTSATGAAIRDILNVLRRRNSAVNIMVCPVKVQGAGAAEEIAAGIDWFNRERAVDVLIVGRGGGSLEDLWAFNEEPVARAIHASHIPVISAVGHEVDFTIADFVADVRAATPSAAAEIVAGAADELTGRIDALLKSLCSAWERAVARWRHRLQLLVMSRGFPGLQHRLATRIQRVDEAQFQLQFAMRTRLDDRQRRLERLTRQLMVGSPLRRLEEIRHRLGVLRQQLQSGMDRYLTARRSGLVLLQQKLDNLGPRKVLNRGYALCLDPSGRLVRDSGSVRPGDEVDVILQSGRLDCRVEQVRPEGTRR